MNPRKVTWFVALAMLTVLAAATAPAFPMTQEGDRDTEAGGAPPQGEEAQGPTPQETVDAILREHEQNMITSRFTYDPESRRDPFRSLYDEIDEGDRPPGIEGMTVTEIDLTGIVQDGVGGDVAYFTGSDNKGYFLRVGDRVYDATVIAIDLLSGSVTFRQQVDDPRQIKPYRDVVRKLVPLEGDR